MKPSPVIGVDEVGRGCLAGPVVAAACILLSENDIEEFTDSKLLSEPRRELLFEKIMVSHSVGIGVATVGEIDKINILQASFLAMRRALKALNVKTGHVVVDGHMKIPKLKTFAQTPLIKGDLRCKPISAASIVAKVTRDRMMRKLAKVYPGYGFDIHKGYGTPGHRKALGQIGPCDIHRRTFAGVEFDEGIDLGDLREEVAATEAMEN